MKNRDKLNAMSNEEIAKRLIRADYDGEMNVIYFFDGADRDYAEQMCAEKACVKWLESEEK